MNSLERVVAAVGFQKTDRVPVIAQVFAHAATLESCPGGRIRAGWRDTARCQLKALAHYGYAPASVMDVSVEAEAVGSVLEHPAGISILSSSAMRSRLWTRGRLQRPPIPKRPVACRPCLERHLVCRAIAW